MNRSVLLWMLLLGLCVLMPLNTLYATEEPLPISEKKFIQDVYDSCIREAAKNFLINNHPSFSLDRMVAYLKTKSEIRDFIDENRKGHRFIPPKYSELYNLQYTYMRDLCIIDVERFLPLQFPPSLRPYLR